jgi:hypothetical protein
MQQTLAKAACVREVTLDYAQLLKTWIEVG